MAKKKVSKTLISKAKKRKIIKKRKPKLVKKRVIKKKQIKKKIKKKELKKSEIKIKENRKEQPINKINSEEIKILKKPIHKKEIKRKSMFSRLFGKSKKHHKKSIPKITQIPKKLDEIKKTNSSIEELNKQKSTKKGTQIFLFIITILLGAVAVFMFPNNYVYIIVGLLLLLQIIFLIKKKKKVKLIIKKEIKKEQPKKIYLTEFDKFYNYIMQNDNVPLAKISRYFKMSKKQAEEWAKILEERGLVKVSYPLVGDPVLKCPS